MQDHLKKQLWITASSYLGQLLVGYGIGWTTPILHKIQDPEQSPLPTQVTETEAARIVSIKFVGIIIGSFISGYLSNVAGRKPCFYLGGFLALLSFLLLATASNLAMIYVGRVFIGFGTGIILVSNLVYIGEIASSNVRGILLTVSTVFSTFGTLLVYVVGHYFSYSIVSYIPMGISALYILGIIFMPESPTYLDMKGRTKEANEVLNKLGRSDECIDIKDLKVDIQKQSPLEDWKEIVTVKGNRKALFITLTLGMLQQGSGYIPLISFVTTIFASVGSSIKPHIATIIIGVGQNFASAVTPFVVERLGRKILLLFSTALCSLSLTTLGVYFYLDFIDHPSTSSIRWLPLIALIVFFLSYDIGFGIIPNILIGELYHSKVRSTGSTVSLTLITLTGFGVTSLYGYMTTELGNYVTFWIFSGICALTLLFTLVFVPETKGKTLDEIQYMLNK